MSLQPTMITSVPAAKATVHRLASVRWVSVLHCCSNQLPVPFGMPSMSGSCPVRTEMPTPVRKPIRTEALRKSPRKPSRSSSLSSRARISIPPHTRATRLVHATHSAEFGESPEMPRPASPAARIAAVAESAPTTSSRDEPSSANISVGKMIVYRPVITGVCAIEVYPITSGTATAASVTPASTSTDSQLTACSGGSTPARSESATDIGDLSPGIAANASPARALRRGAPDLGC